MKVIAVIPAFNEAAVISHVVAGVKPHVNEVVVVDDGSRDDTGALARVAGAVVARHIINRGQGAAEETGTQLALRRGADIIVHFDADGQHDATDIQAMIAPIVSGHADITLGSRFLGQTHNMSWSRAVVLRAGLIFIRFFTSLRLTDAQNGFRAFSRRAAEQIHITQDGMAHASEILDQIADRKLRWQEVPVTIHYTAYSKSHGQSNFNALRIAWRLFNDTFLG